jgi:hypothetical protein
MSPMACVSAAEPERQKKMRSEICVSLSLTRFATYDPEATPLARRHSRRMASVPHTGRCARVGADDDTAVEGDRHDSRLRGARGRDMRRSLHAPARCKRRTPRSTSPFLSAIMGSAWTSGLCASDNCGARRQARRCSRHFRRRGKGSTACAPAACDAIEAANATEMTRGAEGWALGVLTQARAGAGSAGGRELTANAIGCR